MTVLRRLDRGRSGGSHEVLGTNYPAGLAIRQSMVDAGVAGKRLSWAVRNARRRTLSPRRPKCVPPGESRFRKVAWPGSTRIVDGNAVLRDLGARRALRRIADYTDK
jgi:hypothetical protein